MTLRTAWLAVVLGIFLLSGCLQSPSDAYSVQDGLMHYPESRPAPAFNATVIENTSNHTLAYLAYQSHGGVLVHALLRVPKTDENGTTVSNPPLVMMLPGATVNKEGRQELATKMQNWGYATLTLDLRGNGKTPRLHSLDDDFAVFQAGNEPEEAQMVYDVLGAFELLSDRRFNVDSSRVMVLGESMGGRYGIIATAMEPKIKGMLVLSSSGYGLPQGRNENETAFLRLIDPDRYVAQIAPRPILFIHDPADNVVPYASARGTFERAGQLKEFTDFHCENGLHGYCHFMDGLIRTQLRRILSS